MKVLMVEDERNMAEAIAHVLKMNKYIVDVAFDGETGLDQGLSGIYDLIILDIMLPKIDGLRVLKELRESQIETPIILLTAKGQTEDKVMGLDSGADDYLAKPFPTEELLARMRALGRRKNEWIQNGILVVGDIELNPHHLDLRCRKQRFKLTLKECLVLKLLMEREGMTISKETMIEKVWGYDSDATHNHVEVYISFLRKKLRNIQSSVFIQTVRGLGYVLKSRAG